MTGFGNNLGPFYIGIRLKDKMPDGPGPGTYEVPENQIKGGPVIKAPERMYTIEDIEQLERIESGRRSLKSITYNSSKMLEDMSTASRTEKRKARAAKKWLLTTYSSEQRIPV